jgi:hypothetical protein
MNHRPGGGFLPKLPGRPPMTRRFLERVSDGEMESLCCALADAGRGGWPPSEHDPVPRRTTRPGITPPLT